MECVPAQVIALFVEFGVTRKFFGVDTLFDERIVQWSDQELPASCRRPASTR